jgi:chemotaxis family two-component system sensor kinase Cph1
MSLPVTAANVDLSNCEREQIHIPGSIQAQGFLLVINRQDRRVLQVSANTGQWLGRSPQEVIGMPLADFLELDESALEDLEESNPRYLAPMNLVGADGLFEGSIHYEPGQENALLLQLEPYLAAEPRTRDIYTSANAILGKLQRTRSLAELSDLVAKSVRDYTSYDRVLVYRFLADESGEVIAESRREDLHPLLGLRYPASDIPKQARVLYVSSRLRIIADVNGAAVPLVPVANPETGQPLDMRYCVLRSVSPIHLQYLRNMGVAASMSLSLIEDGKLWGLVACHHEQPKRISHASRIACELLAHSLSLYIRTKQESEHRDYSLKLQSDMRQMTARLSGDESFEAALLGQRPDVMSLFRPSGAAVVTGTKIHLQGMTPSEPEVKALIGWLRRQVFSEGVWSCERLSELYPEAEAYRERASGVLAVDLGETELRWLLWFRPEVVQMVNWAGDPNKPVEVDLRSGVANISPRRSFALWREEKRGYSEPWLAEEVRVAVEMRRALMEILLRRMQILERANQELTRSNTELESFVYSASHDLKQPLRGIQLYMQMAQDLPKQGEQRELDVVLQLSKRMEELLDSLMEYARVGKMELQREEIEGDELVRETLLMLRPDLQARGVEVRVPRPLPRLSGDRVRLRQLFQNLIVNAAKYNDKPAKFIEIGFQAPAFYVLDNGIGIEARHHESIFQIFRRLHGEGAYGGGTGAGLTIAQRVVERHGGRIWLESEPGQGTTFFFTLGS